MAVKRETCGLHYDMISPSVYSPMVGMMKGGLGMDDAQYLESFLAVLNEELGRRWAPSISDSELELQMCFPIEIMIQ